MLDAGQHNLSIALRHLLQQVVDSTNVHGQKHTDMSLPCDGYKQKLSWYFECDQCQYKAFYSHEMETHKRCCSGGLYPHHAGKKRKLAPPRRVTSSTHPPNTDSDQDSEQSLTAATTHIRQLKQRSAAPPLPQLQRSNQNIISMEPHDIQLDTSSPDHEDRPVIPAFIDNRQALDFDCVGTVQNKGSERASVQTSERDGRGEMTAHHSATSQPAAYYDPTIDDISEIKMELDPDHISPKDTPPSYHPKHDGNEYANHSSEEALMSTFGSGVDHNTGSSPHRYTPLAPPELTIGNITSLKKSLSSPKPSHSAAATSATATSASPLSTSAAVTAAGAKKVLSIKELERRVLRSYGKVVNYTQVKYTIFAKFYVQDLRTRMEIAMTNLSNKQYGFFINGRFYKSPFLTREDLAVYGIDLHFYQSRLAPAATKNRFSIAKEKAKEILDLYNFLFKVNETSL